jgi:hypothetical protein
MEPVQELPEKGIASSAPTAPARFLEQGMDPFHHRPGVDNVYRLRKMTQKAQELAVEDGA